jgi:hypothetical protein
MVKRTMVRDVEDVEYLRKVRALDVREMEREATAALRREPLLDGDGGREGEGAAEGAGGGARADADSNEDDAEPDEDEPDP